MRGYNEGMARIDGLGAVVIYARDPALLARWYRVVLGIDTQYSEPHGVYYTLLEDSITGATIRFGIEPSQRHLSEYGRAVMINFRVDDFDEFLEELAGKGFPVESIERHDYGEFAYLRDPEGNPIEIWGAAKAKPVTSDEEEAATDEGTSDE